MRTPAIGTLVMAAGKGTRMKSRVPKVLHPILDKPMLDYLLKTVSACSLEGTAVLVGSGGEVVEKHLANFPSVEILWQKQQLGTGHAVQTARSWWSQFDHVLVLNGDLPLLRADTLRAFVDRHLEAGAACSLLSFETDFPGGYGRVERSSDGKSVAIIEHKDATPEQLEIREVNGGCYLFDARLLARVIDRLANDNAQGEYYLPDVVSLLQEESSRQEERVKIQAVPAPEEEMLGVNTQAELAAATARMRSRIVGDWMSEGVSVADPSAVWVGPDVVLAAGVRLEPGAQIWGNSTVGEESVVGPYCVLRNAKVGRRVRLIANVIVEESELCDDAKAGPFAYIRDGSRLREQAFAGKFVELKKTDVGRGSKVPHLSYMGDATLGEDVNIGAGSITCNYDGKNKYPTKIGDRCFVGSDTMMVAPVVLEDDSATGAGSTITADVPEGALGVGRARQKNIEGWVRRRNELWNEDSKSKRSR